MHFLCSTQNIGNLIIIPFMFKLIVTLSSTRLMHLGFVPPDGDDASRTEGGWLADFTKVMNRYT